MYEAAETQLDRGTKTHFGFTMVSSRVGADVLTVDDVSSPGERNLWAAVLQGSYLVTPKTLKDKHGAKLKYEKAMESKRKIWLSGKCLKKQPVLAKIIKGCVALEASRFKLIETEASFLLSKVLANRDARPRMVLGMVATKEKATKGKNYNTSSEVLSFIENIDPLKSSMGMSGR